MNEDERRFYVRETFGAIARRYDFLNHLLSGNVDRYWRRACVREVSKRITVVRPKILDIGCGTGDLSVAFSSLGPVVGCDFCSPMLRIGRDKTLRHHCTYSVSLLEGDALALPFPDRCFDVAVSAFVLRNLTDVQKGLVEMKRVLCNDGVLGVLDFSMPKVPLIGSLYRFYFLHILPKLGALISGVNGAYQYFTDSVQSFPEPSELEALIERAGFEGVEHRLLTGGIAVLLLARPANHQGL
jgi:demethylmenaquinone methyltransferase/2-methoxy-6-polyprenyl-1,4-benzoquinol methylase